MQVPAVLNSEVVEVAATQCRVGGHIKGIVVIRASRGGCVLNLQSDKFTPRFEYQG
jgi:hypothetical protein